jgi:hypothetical protein
MPKTPNPPPPVTPRERFQQIAAEEKRLLHKASWADAYERAEKRFFVETGLGSPYKTFEAFDSDRLRRDGRELAAA